MKIGVVKERRPHERRCAVSPDSIKKYVAAGAEVLIETGAGAGSAVPDAAFEAAGARIVPDTRAALSDADVVLKVQRPMTAAEGTDELSLIKRGALLAAILNPYGAKDAVAGYAQAGIVACAMELMPRISRAQNMDVLSSQSNLAGYKAVLGRGGGIRPRLPDDDDGGGHDCRRRGSSSWASASPACRRSPPRAAWAPSSRRPTCAPPPRSRCESLGATFVAVEDEEFKQAETAGGYAKEMSDAYKAKQAALVAEHIKKQDIVITTALDPGPQGAGAGHRGHGEEHEAGLGHRRPGGGAGRQLPALRTGPGGGEARREAGRPCQRAEPPRRRRQLALCQEPAEFPDAS